MEVPQTGEYDYITQRLDDQAEWYSKKSSAAKRNFHRINVVTIVAASMIPIAGVFDAPQWVSSILGGTAALSSGLLSLFGWQQIWVKYRGAAETLQQEKILFMCKAGPYVNGSIDLLVERCEEAMANERENWSRAMQNVGLREARRQALEAARRQE